MKYCSICSLCFQGYRTAKYCSAECRLIARRSDYRRCQRNRRRTKTEEVRAYERSYKKKSFSAKARNLSRCSGHLISADIIKEVFGHDDYTCQYCFIRGGKLTIDHKIPVSRGGGSERDNLCTACHSCNCSKGAKTPEEFEKYKLELV